MLDDFVSSKLYGKRDDFDFDIVHFPFLDGDIPQSLFDLLVCLVMSLTLTLEIKF